MTDTVTETNETEAPTQQTSTDSWVDSLPETLREAPFLSKAESPEKALQELQNAAGHLGNSLRLPSEDASEEDRKAFYDRLSEKVPGLMPKPTEENMEEFYKALGRPENPDDYNYEPPEGKEVPGDFESFAKVAHKHGLTQEQFRGVLNDVLSGQWEQAEIAESEQNQEMSQLSQEWGQAFDQNLSAVKNFLRLTDAPEGVVDLISEGAMSPAEIKWLHSIASSTKSPTELVTQQTQQETALTPSEARTRIQEMMNNPEHPYWNATDPRHQDAIQKMLKLQKAANPGG